MGDGDGACVLQVANSFDSDGRYYLRSSDIELSEELTDEVLAEPGEHTLAFTYPVPDTYGHTPDEYVPDDYVPTGFARSHVPSRSKTKSCVESWSYVKLLCKMLPWSYIVVVLRKLPCSSFAYEKSCRLDGFHGSVL